jgi:hypothetical protein
MSGDHKLCMLALNAGCGSRSDLPFTDLQEFPQLHTTTRLVASFVSRSRLCEPFPARQIAARYATSRRTGFADAANTNVTLSTEAVFLEVISIDCGTEPWTIGRG